MASGEDHGDMTLTQTVVCDNGSGFVKAGFAGDTFPRGIFPCVDAYVGAECLSRRAQQHLSTSYPISEGIVRQWTNMQLVWDHTFREVLHIEPRDCRIMLTDPPMNPTENRRRMLETMFDVFGFQRAFIQVQAVLTLYSQGLLTGLVLDSGDGVTHAVPVVEGFSSPHVIRRLDLAGRHLTAHLADLLARRGYAISATQDLAGVQRLKEKLCYVALDYQQEAKLARETTCCVQSYTLPDGRVITVGPERYQAPEALFRPSLLGLEAPGIAELVHGCIADSAIDNRMALYSHIVLSGGTTLLPGFGARLAQELRGLYLEKTLKGSAEGQKKLKLRVEDPPRRRVAVFMGASVLASIMADQPEFWVSKEEWQEDPQAALAKCAGALAR